MEHKTMKILYAIGIVLMLIGLPIALAFVYFPGLPATIEAAVTGAGCTSIGIGVAVIAGTYLVYHMAKTTWIYYHANTYDKMSNHAYLHINDFPNIWKTTPTQSQFAQKCKDTMNSGNTGKYYQLSDNRLISYNPTMEMAVVGETDGKTIVTCYRMKLNDVLNKLATSAWKTVKKY
jgi:hypothetical protein